MTAGASAMTLRRGPLRPGRPDDGLGRSLMLAVAVHIGLVVALAFGVRWKNREPEAMSAELWSAVPQLAAPKAIEPEPPKPQPTPQPVPKVPTPPQPTPEQLQRDADIAIEKARAREAQAHREQEEMHRQREEKKRELAEKQAAEQRAAEKREAEQRAQAEAEKKRQQEEQRAQAQRDALRKEQLARVMGQANANGEATARGTAAQSSGPSASYAGRIKAAVRPNIVFNPDDAPGNPTAEVEVRLAPDGSILGTPRLVRSSGNRGFDDAVIRALVKTERLPRDTDGHVEPSMVIAFRPRE